MMGPVELRHNAPLSFVENGSFDPDLMTYDAGYQNSQASSEAFLSHMRSVLGLLKSHFLEGARLVEVGCGKGDFIEMVQADGWFHASGYDAAYEGKNPSIEKRFLGCDDRVDADIVVLRHVLEHIHTPHRFVALLSKVFRNASIYVEVPEFGWIEKNQTFFDITYEHVNYFSPDALAALFKKCDANGLLFGGQYQYIIASIEKTNLGTFAHHYANAVWQPLPYDTLFPSLNDCFAAIEGAAPEGRVFVWGAATKGVLFCHHLKRLQPNLFSRIIAAIDINPMKQGCWLPSSVLPILSDEAYIADARDGDVILVMNPNYANEIEVNLAQKSDRSIAIITV